MKPNPKAAAAYELHTAHKTGDWRQRAYLGLAESAEEVRELIAANPPRHYSIIASCVDGSPTLRLNYREKTDRIGLKLLNREAILSVLANLETMGIERRDRLNALHPKTLRERWLNKLVRYGTGLFDRWNRWRYQSQSSKKS